MIESTITRMDLSIVKDIDFSVSESFFNGDYGFWNTITSNLYIYIPLLTMGLMSRELSSGSIKLLYSSPVTSSQIVLGKFLAAIIYGIVLLIIPIMAVLFCGCVVPHFDWGAVLPGLLGLYLLTCVYCSIGLFMSSLTSYQVVAAVGTLIVLALLSFVGTVGQEYDFIREITYWLSISGRTGDLLTGFIRSEDIIYFIVVIAMFITITILKISFSRSTVSKAKSTLCYTAVIFSTLLIGYVTSRPSMVTFWDCTRTKTQTITKAGQDVLSRLKGKVTVTNYVNLIDNNSFNYLPLRLKSNERIFNPYQRFKADLDVKYVYYYDFAANGLNNNAKHSEKSLEELRDYIVMVYNLNPNLFKSPEEMRKIVDLSTEQNTFVRIIETEDGRKAYLRDFNDMQRTPSEAEIIAVFKKMVDKSPKVGFVRGHGEREISRPGDYDYSAFAIDKYSRAALVNQGFEVTVIDMSEGEEIPSEINLIVISDMKSELSEGEYQMIDRYIDRGGNMLIMTDVGRQSTMNPLISRFGIKMEDGILAQPIGDFYPSLILSKATKDSEKLTFGFRDYIVKGKKRVSMPNCVALTAIGGSDFKTAPVLVTNDKGAWIERETLDMKEDVPVLNPAGGEVEKEYVTAWSAVRKNGEREQRVMILGDADCFSNAELSIGREGYNSGNFNMIVETFRWLADGDFPIDTRREKQIDNKISLTVESVGFVKMLFIVILPLLMLITGVVLWLIRRRH